jgi:hypothetical protein
MDDDIRISDEIYSDTLINDDLDEEMKLALEMSYCDNQFFSNYDIEKATKLSMEEFEKNKLKMDERKKSLEGFCKKIKALAFSNSDITIKNYIEQVLNDYFNLTIDNTIVPNDIKDHLYKIIDSYYFIPKIKNFAKTAISKEEDDIIRQIFLFN